MWHMNIAEHRPLSLGCYSSCQSISAPLLAVLAELPSMRDEDVFLRRNIRLRTSNPPLPRPSQAGFFLTILGRHLCLEITSASGQKEAKEDGGEIPHLHVEECPLNDELVMLPLPRGQCPKKGVLAMSEARDSPASPGKDTGSDKAECPNGSSRMMRVCLRR